MSLNEAKVTACWHKWILKNKHKSEKRCLTIHLLSWQPQLSGPLGLHNVCTFLSAGDGSMILNQVLLAWSRLQTSWLQREGSVLVTGARPGNIQREKKLVPSVLLNKPSPSHLTRSGLQSSCHLSFTSGPDLSWQESRHIQWQLQDSTIFQQSGKEPVSGLLGRTRNLIPFH